MNYYATAALTSAFGASSGLGTKNIVLLIGFVLLGAVVVNFMLKKKKKREPVSVKPLNLDKRLSGMMRTLGGMLVSDRCVIHVTHWPVRDNQEVLFDGRNGVTSRRKVVRKQVLAGGQYGQADLSVLFLDRPLPLDNHEILPIAEADMGKPVTMLRIRKPPFATRLQDRNEHVLVARATDDGIESGDSGKPWIQEQDGKLVVVSLTSKDYWGEGPNLWAWRDRIMEAVNSRT